MLRIHVYLPRFILDRDEHYVEITIFAIYCVRAKKQGKQYTKRILPPFVIPECNISFTNVLTYIHTHPDGTVNYDDAAHILGTYDERTIKKHIKLGWKIIQKTIIQSLEFLAIRPSYTSIPEKKPGQNLLEYLETLTDEIHHGHIRMGKTFVSKSEKIIYLHMVYWYKKSRNHIVCTLDHVFINLHFYDTS